MTINAFIDLAQSLQPALARCLLTGDVRCLDSYNRATTISPLAKWRENAKGYWLGQSAPPAAAGGGIDVAYGAEMLATNGILFFTVQSFRPVFYPVNVRVLYKAVYFDVVVGDSMLYLSTDAINYRAMVSSSLLNFRTAAIRFNNGAAPQLYVDGVYRVTAVGTNIFTPSAGALTLGNAIAGNVCGDCRNEYGFFGIFNDALLGRAITDQEIAELHDAWESIISIKAPKRTISLPVQTPTVVTATPLVHLAGPRTPTGLWPDISGNGRDGTISGCVTQTKGPKGTVQVANGLSGTGGPLIVAAATAALNPTQITVSVSYSERSAGYLSSGAVFNLLDGGANRFYVYHPGGPGMFWFIDTYTDASNIWQFTVPAVNTGEHHLVVRRDRSNPASIPYIMVDGEVVVPTLIVPAVGTLLPNASPIVRALSNNWDGAIRDVQVYGSLLSDAECRALYVQTALLNEQRLANRTDYPISVAAVTASGTAGPWNWIGQSINWSDNGTRRQLLGGGINTRAAVLFGGQPFGAWYWRHKANTVNSALFMMISSAPGMWGGATQNGYILDTEGAFGSQRLYLMRVTNGVAVAVILSSAAGDLVHGVEYEIFVTRRPRDSLFSVWIRGGAYATWTSIGVPAVDATYTTSVGVNVNINASDTIADVTFFPDGGTLLPTDIPWLV